MSNPKYAKILVDEHGAAVGEIVRVENEYPDGSIIYFQLDDPNGEYRFTAEAGNFVYVSAPQIEAPAVQVISNEVTHPSHYQHPSGIEVIQITKHESFLRGNIIKYVLRAPSKGTELLDLKKARQYLDWEIERLEAINNAS